MDFGRQRLDFWYGSTVSHTTFLSKSTEISEYLPNMTPRIRHLGIVQHAHFGGQVSSDKFQTWSIQLTDCYHCYQQDSYMPFMRVITSLRSVYLDLDSISPFIAVNPDQWRQLASEYAQMLAPALTSLRRISLYMGNVSVSFTVEQNVRRIVSMERKRI